MAQVILRNLCKDFGETKVVRNVNLEIPDREFFVLVGPSGCGKSTTLRMIAGLEEITSGEIWIGDRLVNKVPPKDRDIAMVFQNYALYPHMSVYQNMAFGLKLRKFSKKEIQARVMEAAEILNIEHLLKRRPGELSGGQRQRVAVGRSIVRKPKVFLFDEPLSNLDAKMRTRMRVELSKLHNRLQATMIYVTHDQLEAMTLANRVAVMKDGIVQQVAPPIELYSHPANKFVAGFIGSPPMNFMEVTLARRNGGSLWFEVNSKDAVRLDAKMSQRLENEVGKKLVLGIRPEDIYDKVYYVGGPAADRVVKGRVDVVEPMGAEKYIYLSVGAQIVVARVHPNNEAKENQEIDVVFNMDKAKVFDPQTDKVLW
jgi:multiple sugar transport system ATP-binding protein